MNIEIYPIIVFKKLLYLILTLLCANILGIISKLYLGHNRVYGLIPLFDFNIEKNIPTLYSSFSLIVASILLWFISSSQRRMSLPYIPWLGLAIIFLFLSIDEFASIHERFTVPVRESLNTSGLLFYAWVIPYGVGLAVFLIVYFKFLINLPKRIMFLFIISGSIFVAGAVGFELLGGRQSEIYGNTNLTYALYYTCEEFCEMLGIVVFIYSLLMYIAGQFKPLAISIKEQ